MNANIHILWTYLKHFWRVCWYPFLILMWIVFHIVIPGSMDMDTQMYLDEITPQETFDSDVFTTTPTHGARYVQLSQRDVFLATATALDARLWKYAYHVMWIWYIGTGLQWAAMLRGRRDNGLYEFGELLSTNFPMMFTMSYVLLFWL